MRKTRGPTQRRQQCAKEPGDDEGSTAAGGPSGGGGCQTHASPTRSENSCVTSATRHHGNERNKRGASSHRVRPCVACFSTTLTARFLSPFVSLALFPCFPSLTLGLALPLFTSLLFPCFCRSFTLSYLSCLSLSSSLSLSCCPIVRPCTRELTSAALSASIAAPRMGQVTGTPHNACAVNPVSRRIARSNPLTMVESIAD